MAATLALIQSPRVRYAMGSMMYFAQGIPQGLLAIAIPAWLASLGVGAGEISSYMAVIVLPWAFKLVTGPFMDRYQFPAMGRRRPWILTAQLGLSLALLALMLVDDPVNQMGLLMLVGVLINSFAATQDVAVDGLAIDVTPVNEQGRLNSFMTFGKAAGWALTAAATGVLLVTFGLKVTAIVCSLVAGLIFLAAVSILERPGERRLPWSDGEAKTKRQAGNSFRAVFGGISDVLWKRASVIVMMIMLFEGLVSGYGHALMPIAAINVFGYTTPEWSQLVALMGVVGAGVSLFLGPLIDRFGAKKMMFMTVVLVAVHAVMIGQTQHLWENTLYVRVMLSFWVMMVPVVMVCAIALAMAVCKSGFSATQFAIYMSVANLGHSAGSKLFGMVADRSSYDVTYTLMAALAVVVVIVLFFHHQKIEDHRKIRHKSARGHVMPVMGGKGGLMFSGAMRCPKCRSDMEIVEIDGQEIDRCTHCHGIWFDVGELEVLNNEEAARAIDIGSAREGKQYNFIDDYRCPRCGGEMDRTSDPEQQHIWYESCRDCQGSFFDAGEFRDLSEHTVSDFFKWLVTPARK